MTKKTTSPSKRKAGNSMRANEVAKTFRVVGLGASAGGMQAIAAFFRAMPSNTGMAFVLVYDVDPEHESLMKELLAQHTKMPLAMAENGMPVAPDHVYVIPPNRYMEIRKGILQLFEPRDKRGTRLPINRFLVSLAADQGGGAVAVILSGPGTDGSAGIAEIRAQGGIVLVQDPAEAQQDGMLRNAIATGASDHIGPIAKLSKIISAIARNPLFGSSVRKRAMDENARQSLAGIVATLKKHSPINFYLYKESVLLRRIERRMVLRHLQDAADYHALLRDSPEEADALCRDMLISVTSFFRDADTYAWLEKSVLPDLAASHQPSQAIRVWVPGCATGEEAYSLAMLLIEQISAVGKGIRIQIFATDVDEYALTIARAGIYPESIENDVSRTRLDRFFVKEDHSYRVTRELRDAVVFANQNVLSDAPFSKLDMISCRNLLIYLKSEAQDRVLELFHFALNDGGILFLGMSETVGQRDLLFDAFSKTHRIFKRLKPSKTPQLQLPTGSDFQMPRSGKPVTLPSLPGDDRLAQESRRILLEQYAPPAVLVNAQAQVLSFEGRTDQFLKAPPGEINGDLLAMAHDGLRNRLASVLRAARKTNAVARDTATLIRDGRHIKVDIYAHPVVLDGAKLFLVTFQDQARAPQNTAQMDQHGAYNHQLEQELETTRADLLTTISNYERTTEELKAAKEEDISVNEAFQSANEELETSKEELQSLNEELTTLNTQIQQKIEDERHLSDDLNNFLATSGIATIFLNRDREIIRFTPKAQDFFNLNSKDIGRAIGDIVGKIEDPTLSDDIAQVQDSLVPVLVEIKTTNGKWFNRRILPYRTQDQTIDGVVITFSDVSELKEFQRKTLLAQRIAQSVVNTVRDPLLALDGEMNLVWAGRSFFELFATTDEDVIGKSLFTVAQGQLNIPELRRNLKRVLPDQMPIESFSFSLEAPGKGKRDLVLSARKLVNDHPSIDLILVALEDVTEEKHARQALRDRESRLQAILNAVPEAIITINTDGIVTSYSPPSAVTMGYTQSEVLGQNVSMLMPEPHRHKHDTYISAYLKTGDPKVIGIGRELDARHKSGNTMPVHLTVTEVIIDEKKQFIGVIRDLTKEKESRKQLEQAQKMEAVGQLTGGIAHDFNNLLTVIIGNIELLEMHPDNPDRKAILAEALEAANLGAALVSKLLLFSKNQNLAPTRLNLKHVIEDIQPLLLRSLGEQIEIKMELASGLDPVLADPGQIETAVLNLAINARDAMPHGGTLTIGTRQLKIDGNQSQKGLNDLAPGDYVVLTVADTGVGMTPEVLDRVFEPFFTTKDVGKGSGLGLPMIFGWARKDGGNLVLTSEPNKGTVASLYLPAVRAEKSGLPKAESLSAKPNNPLRGAVILLVEDDPRVLNLTRSRLEHLGHSVVTATDGPTALKQLKKHKNISLMLSDVVMPEGIDGIELANKASAIYPDLKIILATGYTPKSENVVWPVLRKPYRIETLSAALNKALSNSI